jgi:hypothetical protein
MRRYTVSHATVFQDIFVNQFADKVVQFPRFLGRFSGRQRFTSFLRDIRHYQLPMSDSVTRYNDLLLTAIPNND